MGSSERGFTLAGLIVILTIISIIVAFTVPEQWSLVMKRERDRQTIFMMKQYARYILAWQQKHGSLPVSLEQLEKARRPRFVRYGEDRPPMPLTGNHEDWIMVPPGAVEQAQAQAAGGAAMNPGPNPGGTPGSPAPAANPGGGTGISSPWQRQPGAQPQPAGGQPAGDGQATKLNPEASPKDYVGPFVAVRPNAKGKSVIAFNGKEDYSEWVFTVQDLQNEIAMRQAALMTK
ncbi:MAG TPA: hypothetical protein VGF48_09875 [Thermoanaerobaculia bacterium]|jgi:type II secretory pathway pseudopilin PulG